MIVITGDTHGVINRLGKPLKRKAKLNPNIVIVLGDFGFPWEYPYSNTDKYWLTWLDKKPFTTLVVPGNHDNWDSVDKADQTTLFGGMVSKISESLYFLHTGQSYVIEGKEYFVFGGAKTTDMERRIKGKTWWPQEVPSQQVFQNSVNRSQKKNSFDYVLSHTAPTKIVQQILEDHPDRFPKERIEDPVCKMLDYFSEHLSFQTWFFGHFHLNQKFCLDDSEYQCVYYSFVKID
ncbi:MAG: metallophosphoesterase [Spirochaetia bacterium]